MRCGGKVLLIVGKLSSAVGAGAQGAVVGLVWLKLVSLVHSFDVRTSTERGCCVLIE